MPFTTTENSTTTTQRTIITPVTLPSGEIKLIEEIVPAYFPTIEQAYEAAEAEMIMSRGSLDVISPAVRINEAGADLETLWASLQQAGADSVAHLPEFDRGAALAAADALGITLILD